MKFRAIVEYEYPIEHKPPVKAELILHGDRVVTDSIEPLSQEPFINKPCVSSGVCEHDKQKVLEKIRDQLKSNLRGVEITLEVLVENDPLRPKMEGAKCTLEDCLELIDMVEPQESEET